MSKPKVVISADNLSADQVSAIKSACEGWAECVHCPQEDPRLSNPDSGLDPHILIGWASPRYLAESTLQYYLCGSAGIDAYLGCGLGQKNGFVMTNAAGVMGVVIAEHCLAMMFSLTRKLALMFEQQQQRIFSRIWDGDEVAGSTACIVGYGNAGMHLARRLRAMDMKVVGVRRDVSKKDEHVDALYPLEGMQEAFGQSDHVFCLLPGGEATRDFFNAERFAMMKPGSFYYSASRGSVTCEDALLNALTSKHLGGAAIDVCKVEPLPSGSPLWTVPGLMISPHSAGHSWKMPGRLTELFIRNLECIRDGKALHNLISPSVL